MSILKVPVLLLEVVYPCGSEISCAFLEYSHRYDRLVRLLMDVEILFRRGCQDLRWVREVVHPSLVEEHFVGGERRWIGAEDEVLDTLVHDVDSEGTVDVIASSVG